MTHSALGVLAVYEGSGTTGPFTLVDVDANPILFLEDTDLQVYRYVSDDDIEPDLLTLSTDYTLTGSGGTATGSITLTSALTAGYTLAVLRREPIVQDLDLEFGGDLSLDNLEARLDKLTRLLQEMREEAARSLAFLPRLTDFANSVSRLVPEPVAGSIWKYDDDLQVEFVEAGVMRGGTATPTSDIGSTGDFYVDTDNGILYGPKSGGAWGSGTFIIGPQGDPGEQGDTGPAGQTILSGSGAPSNGLGSDGDFYIDTVAYDIYGPKASGAWPGGVSLIGPSGAGTGDIIGPSGATDNALARFDSTTGKLLQNSSVTISDTGTIAGVLFTSVGLKIGDTDSSHYLNIKPGSDLTADRVLTFTTGDADRTLVIMANSTISGTAYVSGGTPVAVTDGGTGGTTAALGFANLKQDATTSATGVVQIATAASIRASATGTLAISPAGVESACASVDVSSSGTISIDWDAFIFEQLTLSGNATLANPTNQQEGTWRQILVAGDGTVVRTVAFGTAYIGPGATSIATLTSSVRYLIPLFSIDGASVLVGTPIGSF